MRGGPTAPVVDLGRIIATIVDFEVSKWGLTPASGDLGPFPSEQGPLFLHTMGFQVPPSSTLDLSSVDPVHRAERVQGSVGPGRVYHHGELDTVEALVELDCIGALW